LRANLNWYSTTYAGTSANTEVSKLGGLEYGPTNGPWQQDFLGIVFAQLKDDGFKKSATPFFDFTHGYTVGRFANHPAFCIQAAPGYYFTLRNASNALVESWADLYAANLGAGRLQTGADSSCSLSMAVNGYPEGAAGYAAYGKAMLAVAANAGFTTKDGKTARAVYNDFDKWTPLMRKAFISDPTWAIIPKN
jgi:hypothetical protein